MSKMTPAKARELRDAGGRRPRPGMFVPQPGTRKHRVLRFDAKYPGDAAAAQTLLAGLPEMVVEAGPLSGNPAHTLSLWYELGQYTFDGIASALVKQGFHLDNGWHARFMRAVIAFAEETQLRNMHGPQRLIKKSQDIYSKAWDHHLHGDHDDTPPDLRQDK
ncbi:MAG: hypothetical protein EPO60_11450 [Rugosibacter sp.]|nr:MAG: hypothetical protein EPO60_11450 [Rugosibacter sp.]